MYWKARGKQVTMFIKFIENTTSLFSNKIISLQKKQQPYCWIATISCRYTIMYKKNTVWLFGLKCLIIYYQPSYCVFHRLWPIWSLHSLECLVSIIWVQTHWTFCTECICVYTCFGVNRENTWTHMQGFYSETWSRNRLESYNNTGITQARQKSNPERSVISRRWM